MHLKSRQNDTKYKAARLIRFLTKNKKIPKNALTQQNLNYSMY